jgi:hypothetical protein
VELGKLSRHYGAVWMINNTEELSPGANSGNAAGASVVDALVPAALSRIMATQIFPPCRDVERGCAFFFISKQFAARQRRVLHSDDLLQTYPGKQELD